jgi:hypothetical protein
MTAILPTISKSRSGALEWRDAERRFLEILERKVELPALQNVKDARHVYDEKHRLRTYSRRDSGLALELQ